MSANRFVWTKYNGELHASKRPKDYAGNDGNDCIVASHIVSDEELKLPIDTLAKMYPAPSTSSE